MKLHRSEILDTKRIDIASSVQLTIRISPLEPPGGLLIRGSFGQIKV